MDKNSLSHTTWNCKYHKQTLENPFLGKRLPFFPRLPSPEKTAAGGKPLLVGLPPSILTTAPTGTETQHTRPLLVGRVCVNSEPTALAGGTAASLADAEVGEDGVDDGFGGVAAGDAVQKSAGFEDVRGDHVGAEPFFKRPRAVAQQLRRFPRQVQLPLDRETLLLARGNVQALPQRRSRSASTPSPVAAHSDTTGTERPPAARSQRRPASPADRLPLAGKASAPA